MKMEVRLIKAVDNSIRIVRARGTIKDQNLISFL